MQTVIKGALARAVAFVSAMAAAVVVAATPMLQPYTGPVPKSERPRHFQSEGQRVRFNLEALRKLSPGEVADVTFPDGRVHAIVFDKLVEHGNGITTWMGHHRDGGSDYRTLITAGPDGTFGRIAAPDAEARLVPGEGFDWLVDMKAEAPHVPPIDLKDDARRPPPLPKATRPLFPAEFVEPQAGATGIGAIAKAAPAPTVVVDIMVVYTNGFLSAMGGSTANVQTRIANLIAAANQAYIDSDVAVQLRLATTTMVSYPDSGTIGVVAYDSGKALDDITPYPSSASAPFASIESMRQAAGADMVTFLRAGSSFGGDGVAWIANAAISTAYSPLMYSVMTGCLAGCEWVWIHELGHNMGNAHDRATTAWQGGGSGSFSYSFGHYQCSGGPTALQCNPFTTACPSQPECTTSAGATNNFSDIMAYFHATTTRNLKFSNPLVNCRGTTGPDVPCGIAEGSANSADAARTINNNRIALSGLWGSSGSLTPTTTTLVSSANPADSGTSVTFTATVSSGSGTPAGTVTFRSDGSAIAGCGSVALSGGAAACSTSGLIAGSRAITAVYSGSSTHASSTSATLSQIIGTPLVAPTISLASSLNPSVESQSVTFTASVSGSAGTATGSVEFRDGGITLPGCTAVALSGGTASCSTSGLSVSSHAITARYAGSSTYSAVTSGTLTQTVVMSGTPGAYNVALAANGGIATASSKWNTTLGPAAVNNGNISGAGVGGYWQDANTDYPDWVQIDFPGPRAIERAIVYSPQDNLSAPSEPTDAMTFSAYGVKDFSIQAWSGSAWVTLASVTDNELVKRSLVFSPYTTSRMRILITRSASTHSRLVELEVRGVDAGTPPPPLATPSVALAASPNPSVTGQAVTITATVSGSAGTPTGTVNFRDGGTSISGCASVSLSGGAAACTTSGLALGSHTLTAVYGGNSAYATATSSALSQNVQSTPPATVAPTIGLASSTNPSAFGAAVTFTATVGGSAGAGTGTVTFVDGAAPIPGCSGLALSGGTASCAAAALTVGTHPVSAQYSGSSAYTAGTSAVLSQVVQSVTTPPAGESINVALAANGGVASASSTWNANYPPAATINGDRRGAPYGAGGTWGDATGGKFPDWLQVQFDGDKTIDRVVVYSVQDSYTSPVEPTDTLRFSAMGVTAFTVQALSGGTWTTVASVTGNDLVKREVTFAPVTTSRIRINITAVKGSYSRLAEVEAFSTAGSTEPPPPPTPKATPAVGLASSANPAAFGAAITLTATVSGGAGAPTGTVDFRDGASSIAGCAAVRVAGSAAACTTSALSAGAHGITAAYSGDAAYDAATSAPLSQSVDPPPAGSSENVALASAGSVATASSQWNANYPAAAVINGERSGRTYGMGGTWGDSTGGKFPDWVQVDFRRSRTIDRVVVYSVQDAYTNPSEPTDDMMSSSMGVTSFSVQVLSGSTWVTVATVAGNSNVKREVTFPPVATNRVRINITASKSSYSRLAEVEAWGF